MMTGSEERAAGAGVGIGIEDSLEVSVGPFAGSMKTPVSAGPPPDILVMRKMTLPLTLNSA
jgi:hypothetical protein